MKRRDRQPASGRGRGSDSRSRRGDATGARESPAPAPPPAGNPVAAADFEKLGVFYLGRPYDLGAKRPQPGLLLYDAKDLVTHAVCIGMTGSGKTGLCLALLEEALLDGIPALMIDPKGDLANLCLTFPDLRPEDFAPWINEDDARTKGLSPEAYAAEQAALWARGLAEWGQSGDRIRRLRAAADIAVYTPGSTAGLPLSILKSFAAPGAAVREDPDLLRERIGTTATGLLGLLGIEADPLRSREHILLATILDSAWKAGRDLDLAGVVQQIQTPPVAQVGAVGIEAFYPAKERFTLAMALNNILAAPGFDAWLQGDPLDVGGLLHTPEGKPRAAILSIAHLSDSERMFFVSLLLNETLGWVRAQSGTTSLRALVYMDEIFGYFPPVANPPSKLPLLTLLKQARAFGVGIVLATQNPVDLDYKGLANTGTWFIGRLQTERDKARVLEGLEGVAAGSGQRFDRQAMEAVLAGLGNRIFLLNNVHEDAPVVFQTRWAMSYLRGPLTRTQIKALMKDRKPPEPAAAPATPPGPAVTPGVAAVTPAPGPAGAAARTTEAAARVRPILPPDVPQQFLPVRGVAPGAATLLYRPMLVGAGLVRFADPKLGVDAPEDILALAPITAAAVPVDWSAAATIDIAVSELESAPQEPAQWAELPPAAGSARSYTVWSRDFAGWLCGSVKLELWRHAASGTTSRPGESERDFHIRLQEVTRADRDRRAEALRKKYAPRVAALEERLRRAQQSVEREREQVTHQGVQTAISIGATILGAFLGRKTVSASDVGRATTAARGAGRIFKERQDVTRASENVEALQQQLADLEAAFNRELAAVEVPGDPLTDPLEPLSVRAKKSQVTVRLCALAWVPHWRDPRGDVKPAWS